ncbi:hypothetical protein [Kineothrix sedimenti]|uniref:Phage minor structural protein GP20 n=1 Tax=Kineothrix sedimenti TaxID=3123317 RepID=A0ABZ3ESD3_9FIRM
MNIIEKLKTLGVEITDEMKKTFDGDFVSSAEVQKKNDKIKTLEGENETLRSAQGDMQKQLTELQQSTGDVESWKTKVSELNAAIEKERKEWADKEEANRLSTTVDDFFKDKHFVNDITSNAIKTQLVAELKKDTAKGKSISDLFDSITKDEKGELKPNILIDEKTLEAEKNRSKILGRSITSAATGLKVTKEQFLKMNIEERTKLKESDPDTYDALRKMR